MSFAESQASSIDFQQYWMILRRRWKPASAVFASVFILTAVSLVFQKPVYEAEGKLLFKKISPASQFTGVAQEIGELRGLQEQNNPVDTEAEVIRSLPILKKTIERSALKDRHGASLKPEQFLRQLNISDVSKTDVLQVAYRDTDPQRAATVVNNLMAIYLENNLIANRTEAGSAREFIQQQLPKAQISLRQIEQELRQFKEKNQVVNLDEEAKSAVEVIADMQKQVATLETGLADARTQSEVLRNQLGSNLKNAGAVTSISQFPAVQDVLKEIQQVDSQLAVDRSRFREDHPNVVSLKRKKTSLEQLLQQRLKQVFGNQKIASGNLQNSGFDQKLTEDFVRAEARRLGLSSQLAALSRVQATYRQRLNSLPKLEQKQRELERQLQATQSNYLLLLQKLQEIRVVENQNIGNARVISAAITPEEPVAPRKALYLVTGVILGSLLAMGTAIALEGIDRSIRTVEGVKKAFDYNLLGVIPAVKKSEKISARHRTLEQSTPEVIVSDFPRSPLHQAYCKLQANLKFLSSDKELKAIVVTSSVPQEGKSTVSANLAVTIAQMGRKVLLVDADMHRPIQHKIWELTNRLGLSNIIVDRTEPRTAIKKIMTNLHVLPSGNAPPNPLSLIDSERMASLLTLFSTSYDYVIVDTPPLNAVVDAAILGKMTDGILLVVRPGTIDTASASRAKEFLEQSGQHVLGLAINGFIPENEPYSDYHLYSNYAKADVATTASYSSLTTEKNQITEGLGGWE